MRVFFLTNIPSPYRVEFFDLLSEKCDLTVAYERRSASDRDETWYIDSKNKYKVCFLNGINYSNDAAFAPGVIGFLGSGKYDIIVVSGYSSLTQILALIFLKIRKIPYVLNVDGGVIKSEHRVKYLIKRILISGARLYLSTGCLCDKFLVHYGARPERVRRYPFTSIHEKDILDKPLTTIEKEAYKIKIGCGFDKMILAVGQMIYRKGFDTLLEAMMRINDPDIGCYIVGGNPNEECRKLMETHDINNVFFIPFLRKEQLAEYYKAADLFVFPTREDIWGLVINEAMAYGLPIITTYKCGAGVELVKGNGVLVPEDNVEELESFIVEILQNKQNYGNVSLSIIKKYTLEKMADANYECFVNILEM